MDGGSRAARSMARQDGEWGYSAHIDNATLAPPRSLDWGWPPPRKRVRPDRKPDAPPDNAERGTTPDDEKAPGAKQDGHDQDGGEQKKPPMSRRKKLLYWVGGLLILGVLIIAGVLYWLHARNYESTDDAFIDGYISQIASQVSGRVTRIAFADNQQVKAGQLLVELDPRDYQRPAAAEHRPGCGERPRDRGRPATGSERPRAVPRRRP